MNQDQREKQDLLGSGVCQAPQDHLDHLVNEVQEDLRVLQDLLDLLVREAKRV